MRPARLLPIILPVLLMLPTLGWAAGRFTLAPTLTMMAEWSDNIMLTPEDSEDDKIADYSITAVPGLRLMYDSYRTASYIGFSAGFRHYFENDEYDGLPEYYQGGLGWAYWLNPITRITLTEDLTYFTDPRDQPFTEQVDVESLRTESIANRIGASVAVNVTRVSTVESGYFFGTTEYTEEGLDDTVEHQFNLAWNRQLNDAYRLIVFYDYARSLFSQHYDFLRSMWDSEYTMDPPFPVKLDGPDDFDTHTPGVGMLYQATPSLSFELRSGLILPATEDRNNVYKLDDIDWYQRIEVSKLFWRMTASANYSRNLAPAHGLAGAVLTQTVGGRLEERWTRQFETLQEAAYSNYLQDAADIDGARAAAGANYYFFNWLGLGLSYSYLQQIGHYGDGAPDQRLYAHRITLRLALTSPRPDWLRF